MAGLKDRENLRKQLEKDFLEQLSKNHPGFLTEEEWNEQRKRTNQIARNNKWPPKAFPPDYYTEIYLFWFDPADIVNVLEKIFDCEMQIDDDVLEDFLKQHLAFNRNPLNLPLEKLWTYPGYNHKSNSTDRYGRQEYIEAVKNAAKNTIRRIRQHAAISFRSTAARSHQKVPKATLGRNIEQLRKECGWTVEMLAERVYLEKTSVLDHINKGVRPRPQNLKNYADVFGKALNRRVSVSELETVPSN
jgi:hypothetical protein